MAGGSESALSSGQFLLDEMAASNKLYLVPGGIGAGSNMKMVHQVLAGIHILGASEVMGFAARLGLDAKIAGEGIMGGETWTWMHENRLPRMVEEDWNPGASALTIILKDVVCSHLLYLMERVLMLPGNHHFLCSSGPFPNSPLQHSRTNLPHSVIPGLRRKRRFRNDPTILP